MTDIVIVAAARTAVGKFGGTLAKTAAPELGAAVIVELLKRAKLKGDQIGEVILGQVLTAAAGQNPARQSVIKSGLPNHVPGMTINKVCGSGLKAVMLATQAIRDGDSEIVIAGGQESMSMAPHALPSSRDGQRMGDWKLVDTMIIDGLWDVYNQYHMGITAENVAKKFGVSRADQDALALGSQQKAAAAQDAGKFKDEIVPFSIAQKKGDPIVFAADEFINRKTNADGLAGLRPAFDKAGSVTAGNASGPERRRRRCGGDDGQEGGSARPQALGAHRFICFCRSRPRHHGYGPRCRRPSARWSAPAGNLPIWICWRSTRLSPRRLARSTRKWGGTRPR